MEENMNVENEISLSEIFALLWKKVKLIIVLCLTGCFVGGVFGYVKSYDVVYYGTELTFFVSPKKTSDKDGEEVIYGTYGNTIMDSMVKLLSTEKSVGAYLAGVEGAPKQPKYTEGMDLAEYEEQVVNYNKFLYTVSDALEFTYRKDEKVTTSGTDMESKNFIYVTIKLRETKVFTKEFTRQFLASLQKEIPIVVEGAMLNPDESQYSQTSCTLVTPLYPMVEVMNPNYTITETIKFAVLLAFAVFVATCALLIINDRMDKRIRDTDSLEIKFKVPLLGSIPTIDMSEQTATSEVIEGGNE